MDLTARKTAELRHRLASLDGELVQWRAETVEGGRLEKHFSQIDAVATEVSVPIEALRARIDRLDGAAALEEAAGIEDVIADLHRLWDMFRSRLTLRYVERFAPYLLGADELAYRCYQPAVERGAGREPPLVAFADRVSPVTQPRGQELRPAAALPDGDPLGEALQRLPVALIDLPWSQVEHLPDAPIIAHEVGHDVEADLALGPEMAAALDAALERAEVPRERRLGWAKWREEAFADVFGTLCLGPAFTSALIDVLATAPRSISVEWQADPDWRPHPPSTLRILISTAVLEREGSAGPCCAFTADAKALRALWTTAYPDHAMTAFACDVDVVVDALVSGPYTALGCSALTGLVAFPAEAHERAQRDSQELLKSFRPRSGDARELVAAARLAFDANPSEYDRRGVSLRVLTQVERSQTVGRRTQKSTAPDPAARTRRAVAAGGWLAGHLARAHGLDPADSTREPDV